jgi:YD repeat-containing protein
MSMGFECRSLQAVVRACAIRGRKTNAGVKSVAAGLPRWLVRGVLTTGVLLLAESAAAAPTDCMGASADGQATCTAPIVSGYTYDVCTSSQLDIALAKEGQCRASVGRPIKDEASLQTLISCLNSPGHPSWMGSGDANQFFCGGSVTYKYGQEIEGISEPFGYQYGLLQPVRNKVSFCPTGYKLVGGTSTLPDYCIEIPKDCPICQGKKGVPPPTTPNPMGIANGDHGLVVNDIASTSATPIELTRYYSSTAYYRPVNAANPGTVAFAAISALNLDWNLIPGFGDYWRHTYDRRILVESSPYLMATALRPSGVNKHFRPDGTSVINEDGRHDTLMPTKDSQGNITGWVYTTDDAIEVYAATGELWSITTRTGRVLNMVYGQNGLLAEVDDDVGHYLKFGYDDKSRLMSITDTAGKVTSYGYTSALMLGSVTYPGGGTRSYLYNENPMGRNGGDFGLTGVLDEYGNRVASYGYDTGSGSAYTEHTGGIEHYERTVVDDTHVNLSDPAGATHNYTIQTVVGASRITSVTQPAGHGSAASTSNLAYDGVGNLASLDDFEGHRTCWANDATRMLEGTRVEGLATTVACSTVLAAGSTLPLGSRKISTQWHPDWRLQVGVAEPGRLTTYVYNGQPDPTAGNVIATCAPSNALLPGGKPIAVLCATVERATLDTDGSQAFAAALNTTVPERRTRYTYNGRGQILTITDAGNNTTTYAYYESATDSATPGDLQSVTNAAGHVTTYDAYDKNGLLLQSTDPNGVVTTMTYDDRHRPTGVSITADGAVQSTTYQYNLSGDLEKIGMPDGTTITNSYDVGHRLNGVTDGAGNTVTYYLDDAGHRLNEQVFDPSGTLARNVTRAYDALGRMYSMTGVAQ